MSRQALMDDIWMGGDRGGTIGNPEGQTRLSLFSASIYDETAQYFEGVKLPDVQSAKNP